MHSVFYKIAEYKQAGLISRSLWELRRGGKEIARELNRVGGNQVTAMARKAGFVPKREIEAIRRNRMNDFSITTRADLHPKTFPQLIIPESRTLSEIIKGVQ